MSKKKTKRSADGLPDAQAQGNHEGQNGSPENTGPPASKPRAIRGKRGGLKSMLDMPVDILSEICILLDPGDLLILARTTRPFRAFLMSRSSEWIWKSARKNVPYMPDLPSHMNEPTYANLLYSPYCHVSSSSVSMRKSLLIAYRTVWRRK
ncbi:hypothetical protein CERSUDRAFT_51246 [Gelatoporia subvermispora B]|uniref:F-box domain-containing protein n=1 Tax=Ceriporiopsis subvermispora (strain B) TaxID=914234 RepID=M2QY52_CERS8|nr:hypothetical protein CERSUDRAFT_51246 [Gelatoporia subvermispora B]